MPGWTDNPDARLLPLREFDELIGFTQSIVERLRHGRHRAYIVHALSAIIIGDLTAGYLKAEAARLSQPSFRPLAQGARTPGPGFDVVITPQGGLAVVVGDEHCLVESRLSWPKGDYNWLTCGPRLNEAPAGEWHVRAQADRVEATGTFYRLVRTVDLDPNDHTIVRKYADLSLLSSAAQARIVRLIQAKGGVVVANSQPATRETREVKSWRFVETGGGFSSSYQTHLYTPIALGRSWGRMSEDERNAEGLMADVRGNLNAGALYYYSIPPGLNFGAVSRMFPFTPIGLHEGCLTGEERIVTTRSGPVGWGDESTATCYKYAPDGQETQVQFPVEKTDHGNVFQVELAENEMAVLERVR